MYVELQSTHAGGLVVPLRSYVFIVSAIAHPYMTALVVTHLTKFKCWSKQSAVHGVCKHFGTLAAEQLHLRPFCNQCTINNMHQHVMLMPSTILKLWSNVNCHLWGSMIFKWRHSTDLSRNQWNLRTCCHKTQRLAIWSRKCCIVGDSMQQDFSDWWLWDIAV